MVLTRASRGEEGGDVGSSYVLMSVELLGSFGEQIEGKRTVRASTIGTIICIEPPLREVIHFVSQVSRVSVSASYLFPHKFGR